MSTPPESPPAPKGTPPSVPELGAPMPRRSSARMEAVRPTAAGGSGLDLGGPPRTASQQNLQAVRTASQQNLQAVRTASQQNLQAVRPGSPGGSGLELGGPPRTSSQQNLQAVSVPELGVAPPRTPSVRGMQAVVPPQAPAARAAAPMGGIEISTDDDDDFDMQIERGDASSVMQAHAPPMGQPMGMSQPMGGQMVQAPPSSRRGPIASSGLEVARQRPTINDGASRGRYDDDISIGARIAGFVATGVCVGGTGAALLRFAHRSGGIDIMRVRPHAFDGSSAAESGAFSLTLFVIAVVLGWAWLKVTPRSWAFLVAGGLIVLTSLAMVTVTLSSTGENAAPPDGALLVPYLLPTSLLAFALGIAGHAAHIFARGSAARKLAALPIAVIGGAVAFLAYETSRFLH